MQQQISTEMHEQATSETDKLQSADQEEPKGTPADTQLQHSQGSKRGPLGDAFYAVNRPWLLITLPLLVSGVWLVGHIEIITSNLNKPYALLAGPVFISCLLVGWLIFKFFRTIETWCKMAWQAFFRARKEDGSAQFFWLVIIVFMIVSVFASGSFFTMLEHDALPGLGYATALFIDLVAVQSMRARLNAVRMRDKRGETLYLIGVFVCAGASAFANVYSDLANFAQHATGVLPIWMVNVAPWFGLVFPALILLLSITADYTLDQTSTKLDPENYKTQEEKRIRLSEIQRDMLQRRVQVEQEIDQLSEQLKGGKQQRTFFLFAWLFPKQPANAQQIAAQITEQMSGELNTQLSSLCTYLMGQIGQAYSMTTTHTVTHMQTVQGNLQQVEMELDLLLQEWQKLANVVAPSAQAAPQNGEHEGPNSAFHTDDIQTALGLQHEQKEMQKSLPFHQTLFHQKALDYILTHGELRAQFESILRTHPDGGFESIAALIRQQTGMDYSFLTAQFVAEVWALLQVQNTPKSPIQHPREDTGHSQVLTLPALYGQEGREKVNSVKGLEKGNHAGDAPVNVPEAGEGSPHPSPSLSPLALGEGGQNTDGEHAAIAVPNGGAIATLERPEMASPTQENVSLFALKKEPHSAPYRSRITRQLGEISLPHGNTKGANFAAKPVPISEEKQTEMAPHFGEISSPNEPSHSVPVEAKTTGSQKAVRGPYAITKVAAAQQLHCSLGAIEQGIQEGKIERFARDQSKVLVSSLRGFVPPKQRKAKKSA